MQRISGIYKIQSVCKPDRCYIGSSEHIGRRWQKHIADFRKNKHHSPKLQYFYNKYGESDLILIIIEPCLPEFLLVREQHYIDSMNPYFNTCRIAGNTFGFRHSDVTKNKMKGRSPWNKGTHGLYSEEYKNKLREKRKTFRHTQETKDKMKLNHKGGSGWNTGIETPSDVKEKISKALKGREHAPMSEETKDKLRQYGLRQWELKEDKTAWNKGMKKINGKFVCQN